MIICPFCSEEQSEANKYCAECGAALGPGFEPTVAHQVTGGPQLNSDRTSAADRSQHGRFLPGWKLADRYRIVSLVGKGGMGEVYRADDLKLGHTVALKFLPNDLASDPKRLDYFLSEVRLTRQISHPNVCRVYDIGEADGQHFLSMEYIDGEDLRVLLRRIGRLPHDKGIQIAQQLCAGLAAAHNQGVLHRDLKPANVMLDGRGQVRITDFGLAKLEEDCRDGEVAGTPAYMAPEQLTAGATSVQSDLYSLGLILYELFTGAPVHKSGTLRDRLQSLESNTPSQPSSVVEDIEPAVESVISRCLQKEPADRPKTAAAFAAALPGADPLAAAMAAGETPSPEMVAAAGKASRLPLKVGVGLLAIACGLLVALPFLADWLKPNRLTPLQKNEPVVLRFKATQWIERLGYSTNAKDSTYGIFGVSDFRYRQSSRPLMQKIDRLFGRGILPRLADDNPSVLEPGMISLSLDPRRSTDSPEMLVEFLAVPQPDSLDAGVETSAVDRSDDAPDSRDETSTVREELNWAAYFELVQEKQQAYDSVPDARKPANWRPPIHTDHASVWQARGSSETQLIFGVRDEQLVYFRRISETGDQSRFEVASNSLGGAGFLTLLTVIFSGLLAIRNLKLGRTDARGGLRFAIYYFIVECVLGIVVIHHVASFAAESQQLANYLLYALTRSLRVWLYYVGFEPYVRRLWPDVLITWSRVVSGRFRDPVVGRDLLVGCAFAIAFALVEEVSHVGTKRIDLTTSLGGRFVLLSILWSHQLGILIAFFDLAVLLFCRVLARRTVLTVGLFTLALLLNQFFNSNFAAQPVIEWLAHIAWSIGIAILFMRFGLLSVIAAIACHWLLIVVPSRLTLPVGMPCLNFLPLLPLCLSLDSAFTPARCKVGNL